MAVTKRIMGQMFDVPEEIDDLKVNQVISFAEEKYREIQAKYPSVVDTGRLRAMTIFDIIMELQAIKGKQEFVDDKNTKKVNDLIKMIDKLGLSD